MVLKIGYSRKINDMFFRIASTKEEIARIANFNDMVHGDGLGEYIIKLYEKHPYKDENFWLYLEKENRIISSLTLLKNYWIIGGVTVKIAEMGFVGTAIEFRGKGLFSILNKYYERIASQQEMSISTLRGIPDFYTKRGYSFALPTDMGYEVNTDRIENRPIDIKIDYCLLPEDKEFVKQSYAETLQDQFIIGVFDKVFPYRNFNSSINEFQGSTYIIRQNDERTGFFTIGNLWDPRQVDLIFVSEVSQEILAQLLVYMKSMNKSDRFMIYLTDKLNLSRYLQNISEYKTGWQWQSKIIDLLCLMRIMIPIFEKRISATTIEHNEIKISNYHNTITLRFDNAKLTVTEERGYPDNDVALKIPDNLLPKIIFADKTIEEVNYLHPDCIYQSDKLELLNILFPKLPSLPIFIY